MKDVPIDLSSYDWGTKNEKTISKKKYLDINLKKLIKTE